MIVTAGGKRSETMIGTSGRIERVWGMYPYPNETEIDMVLADITAVTMATASPEIKNSKFYKDAEAPLLWYFTQCSIADQREILVNIILPHAYNVLGRKIVRILWIPKSEGQPSIRERHPRGGRRLPEGQDLRTEQQDRD